MTTEKQIAANRENAKKSTGPRTKLGKRRSRRNAIRHGLTAETVIAVHEDPAAYKALQKAINADYRPQNNFETELISRLVALLWRLRRAVAIESGLLNIQSELLCEQAAPEPADKLQIFYSPIPSLKSAAITNPRQRNADGVCNNEPNRTGRLPKLERAGADIARAFLHLASVDNGAFERLGRYEMSLWRQTVQTILLLNSINTDPNRQNWDDKFLRFRNAPRRSPRNIFWPPTVPFA
jgi:hypothetical protein